MGEISAWVRPTVRRLRAYHAHIPPHTVKLDANENPFDLPGDVKEEIISAIRALPSNRYPDPEATELRELIAEYAGVPSGMIAVGNGSDELLSCIASAFGGEAAVCLHPAFSMYAIISQACCSDVVWVDLTEDFDLDADAVIEAGAAGARPVYIGYPNNPTGRLFSPEAMDAVARDFPGPVVVDEAYYEFSGATMLDKLAGCDKLIILRTFSKAFGLAGWRLGYMIAAPEVVRQVNKVRLPYNVNAATQAAGCVCMRRRQELLPRLEAIKAQRETMLRAMRRIEGLTVFPTDANFILFRPRRDAGEVHAGLLKEGVLVRNLDDGGRLAGCLRVTVGTEQQNEAFLSALGKVV